MNGRRGRSTPDVEIVTDDAERDDLSSSLDELVAEGARRMLIAGLETEVADYVARHLELVDEVGHPSGGA